MSFDELWRKENEGKQLGFFKKRQYRYIAYKWFKEGLSSASEWNYTEEGKYPEPYEDVLVAHSVGSLRFMSLGFYDGLEWHGRDCTLGRVFAWKEEYIPKVVE